MGAITKGQKEAISEIVGRALIDYGARRKPSETTEAAVKDILSVLSLAVLEKYHFYEGEFGFSVESGTEATLIHFTHRLEGEASGGEHPDEVLIWIPTGMVKDLKAAL